ncbi:MAG: hypothetical protein RLZZ265_862 [Verrucomicrobiota bacterium]|jgi:hypothetical protein
MNPSATTPSLSEPSHDEIALTAFLQWEKDGRQSGRDTFYWQQAETQLRELYRQRAERAAAAVQAVRPWPPQPAGELTKSAAKTAAPKSRRATKPNATTPVSAAVAAPAPVSPAKRGSKPVRMASPLATASRLTTVHPVVAAAKASKPSAGTRSSARR